MPPTIGLPDTVGTKLIIRGVIPEIFFGAVSYITSHCIYTLLTLSLKAEVMPGLARLLEYGGSVYGEYAGSALQLLAIQPTHDNTCFTTQNTPTHFANLYSIERT